MAGHDPQTVLLVWSWAWDKLQPALPLLVFAMIPESSKAFLVVWIGGFGD